MSGPSKSCDTIFSNRKRDRGFYALGDAIVGVDLALNFFGGWHRFMLLLYRLRQFCVLSAVSFSASWREMNLKVGLVRPLPRQSRRYRLVPSSHLVL
jgi:hypothetical protein